MSTPETVAPQQQALGLLQELRTRLAAVERMVGLCVEKHRDVMTFPPEAISPPPPDAPAGPYLVATIHGAESPILVFSVGQLLRVADLPPIMEGSCEPISTC